MVSSAACKTGSFNCVDVGDVADRGIESPGGQMPAARLSDPIDTSGGQLLAPSPEPGPGDAEVVGHRLQSSSRSLGGDHRLRLEPSGDVPVRRVALRPGTRVHAPNPITA